MNIYSLKFAALKPRDDKKIQQVFRATLQLVQAQGLAGITMEHIARKARIATGTLYIYFQNKEDLINALFMHCRKSAAGIYFKDYTPDAPFREGLRSIWLNILHHRLEHFEEAVFLEQCYHSPFIAESNKETSKQLFQPLFKLVEQGKKEKYIKNLDSYLLLTFMVGGINEMVKYARYNSRKIPLPALESAFDLCWEGMRE
jgi:TetR/AcrR family transcriptional regulator, repressor of fatR-cypB operon